MEYGKIIAVTGLPGLFELLSSKNDGAIVRSLDDKSTRFVSSRVHNFSHLESIEVFTVRDNVNLIEIFNAMDMEGNKAPDGKDGSLLKKYFEKIFPDLDFERVYTSDLKKMTKWFEVLKANKIEIKLTERPEEPEEPEVEEPETPPDAKKKAKAEPVVSEEGKEVKPKKTAAKKKADPKEAVAPAESAEKEKTAKAPAKKTAPKKK